MTNDLDAERAELTTVLRRAPAFMHSLAIARGLGLPQAYVAAGAVRNTYWAERHGFAPGYASTDVDLVYFAPDLPEEHDRTLARDLKQREPSVTWDVTNQAHVHTWYEAYTGARLAPLSSTVAGIALWPETATCVGARLDAHDQVEIVSPYGLHDLLSLRWRPNPRCPDPMAFARRSAEKRVRQVWPLVEIASDAV